MPRYVLLDCWFNVLSAHWISKTYVTPSHLQSDSRMVGAALKFLQSDQVPWHRVVRSNGEIAERGDGGIGADRQAHLLQAEGVPVNELPSGHAPFRWRVPALTSNSEYAWCTSNDKLLMQKPKFLRHCNRPLSSCS